MKSKKLISLLCAAALSASSFAGLAVTASAATDLFTFTDGSTTGWTMANGTVETVTDEGETDAYLKLQGAGGGNRTAAYSIGKTISGEYTIEYDTMMTRGNGMGRIMHSNQLAFTSDTSTLDTRDGSTIMAEVNEKQNTKYQERAGASVANAALKVDLRPYLDNKWIINDDSTAELVAYPESAVEVTDAKWVRVQAAVNDTNTTVTVIDKAGTKLVDNVTYPNSGNAIDTIYVCSNRGDSGSGIIALDNVHIYQGAPEALTTDGLRGEVEIIVPTVMPIPDEKTQAPGLSAPEGIIPVVNNDFSKTLASVAMGEEAATITDVDGLSITMGSRTGGDTATTVSTADWATGDKVLTLAGGPYSGAGRGPVVSPVDALAIADSSSSVMAFAVNLGSNKADGAGRLYILKDASQAGDTKDGAYNNPMAVLTTDDTAASYTIGSGDNVVTIGQQVDPYTWYKVAVIVSSDKFRVWVAKADEAFTEKPQIDCDHVGSGETASSVTQLPLLAVTSEKGGSYTGSIARIDNMLTYSGTADQPRKLLPATAAAPTPAPPTPTPVPKHTATIAYDKDTKTATITTTETEAFDAVLINAAYDTAGVLASVKSYPITGISNAAAKTQILESGAVTGGKLMLWNTLGDMVPFASLPITDGEAQPTAKPAPTATPEVTEAPTSTPEVTEAPTSTPEVTTAPTSTPEVTTAPTSTPEVTTAPTSTPEVTTAPTSTPEVTTAPTATPVPTYTVSGTVDAGVDTVKLHVKDAADHTADIAGTIDGTTVTFANVVAGTYTVEATAKTGYKNVVVKVGETATATVAVTDADVTNIAITTSPISTATIGVLTGATNIGDKTAEDLSATLAFAAPTAENTVAVTGTLKYVDSYPAMGAVAQTHYYLPYKISGLNENAVVYVQSKDGSNYTDPETGKTYKKVTSASFDNAEKTELFGVQAVSAAKNSLTIMVDSDGDGTVYDKTTYTIDISALTLAEPTTAVPYAEGTITYDEESAAASFVDYSRVKSTVADGANGNATKVQNLQSGTGGGSGAGYNPFTEAYPATGDAVKVSFDITIPARNAWVSVRGTKPGTGNRDNAATNRIFTIGGESDDTVKIYSGTNVVDSIENTDILKKWYHVDAVVNNTTKKTTIKIYNYKANNNYTNETALYDKTVDFRDSTVAGVVAMDYSSNTNNANMQMDNLYINDPSYVEPIQVTATDATVDKAAVLADDVITITPTAKTGQKVTAVKVNGVAITADEGAYKYTVLGTEEAIAVTVEYARADVTAVTVNGDTTQIQKGQSASGYTATLKAGETEVAGDVVWTVVGKTSDNTKFENGTLTIGADETAETVTLTATTRKDITVDSDDDNTISGTKTITVVSEPVYNITKGTETNGTFKINVGSTENATTAKTGDTITIVPTPAAGYVVSEVSYTPNGGDKQVVANNEGYKVTGITADITVNVTFTAIPYTITNSNPTGDDKLDFKVADGEAVGEAATATAIIGQTITIIPTVTDGKYMTLSVVNTSDENKAVATTKTDEGNYTFTMPAGNITISAQFVVTKSVELNTENIAGTYVNFTEAGKDTSYIDTANGVFNIGYMKISNGKLTPQSTAYEDQADVAIISVDASKYAGKIYSASITYDMTAGANNTWIKAIGKFENFIDLKAENASVTANNINTLGGTATDTYTFEAWAYGSTKNKTVTHTTPIHNIFVGDEDGKATIYVYTGTGRLNSISNIKINLTVADDSSVGDGGSEG